MLLFSLPLSFLAPLSVFPPSSPHRNSLQDVEEVIAEGRRAGAPYECLVDAFTGVGLGGPVGASVPYCTEFDLRAPLSRPSLRHAQQLCTCVPMGVDAVMMIGTDGNCAQQAQQQHQQQQQQHQGEEEGSGPASDFTQGFFGRVSGFLSSIDSPTPGGSTGIGERGMEGRGGGSGGGGRGGEGGGRVGRIGVHSLGAPPALLLSGNDAQAWQVLAWLQWLKGCVRTLPVTVLVTVPRDEGIVPPHLLLRLQHAADVVLAMEALGEDNAEMASGISDYKDALGLIRIRKVSVQNSLVPRMPAVTTLVLRAVNRKRQIVVEEAHPPPIDATGGAAGSSGGGGSVGCVRQGMKTGENDGGVDAAASAVTRGTVARASGGGGGPGTRIGGPGCGGRSGRRWTAVVRIHGACIAANDPFAGDHGGRLPGVNAPACGDAAGGNAGDATGGSGEVDGGTRLAPYCPLRSSPGFVWSARTHPFRRSEAEAEAEQVQAQGQAEARLQAQTQAQEQEQAQGKVQERGPGEGSAERGTEDGDGEKAGEGAGRRRRPGRGGGFLCFFGGGPAESRCDNDEGGVSIAREAGGGEGGGGGRVRGDEAGRGIAAEALVAWRMDGVAAAASGGAATTGASAEGLKMAQKQQEQQGQQQQQQQQGQQQQQDQKQKDEQQHQRQREQEEAVAMAGEDRSHVLVSPSRSFVLAAVYDGFAEQHAVDYLLAHLYTALCHQMDACGLHTLHLDSQENSLHLDGCGGGGLPSVPSQECHRNGQHLTCVLHCQACTESGRGQEGHSASGGLEGKCGCGFECESAAGGGELKVKMRWMVRKMGRASRKAFPRDRCRSDWSEASEETEGLEQEGVCEGTGGNESKGKLRWTLGEVGRASRKAFPRERSRSHWSEASDNQDDQEAFPGDNQDHRKGQEGAYEKTQRVRQERGSDASQNGKLRGEEGEGNGEGKEEGKGIKQVVGHSQKQSQQQHHHHHHQERQQQQHPFHVPKALQEPGNDHRRHQMILGALERALASTESSFLTRVKDDSKDQPEYAVGGASLVAAIVTGTNVYVINLGDSRAVIVRGEEVGRGWRGVLRRGAGEGGGGSASRVSGRRRSGEGGRGRGGSGGWGSGGRGEGEGSGSSKGSGTREKVGETGDMCEKGEKWERGERSGAVGEMQSAGSRGAGGGEAGGGEKRGGRGGGVWRWKAERQTVDHNTSNAAVSPSLLLSPSCQTYMLHIV
ncbi:unnamed protein product [Closterium sp. NIES-54]